MCSTISWIVDLFCIFISVVSTVEPGRKPIETEENGDASVNGDILQDINIDLEISKSDDKRPTNGTTEKHNECNTNDHIAEEVASSSGITQISSENDEKKEEIEKVEEKLPEKATEAEKMTENSEAKQVSNDEPVGEKKEKETPTVEEPVEKSIDSAEKAVVEKDDSEAVKVGKTETEPITIPEKADKAEKAEKTEKADEPEITKSESESKEKIIEETPVVAPAEEKKTDEDMKETVAEKQVIGTEKPPTPKHARSTSDEEDIDTDPTSNPCAKKIRLELDEEQKDEAKIDVKPTVDPIVSKATEKETDILETISSEIDAQKESELLDDVVNSALAVEKDPINIDVQPIAEKLVSTETVKPTEETVTEVLLKTDEPVATIPSDLDFTPDEALNELVSSDILAVIPEQPVEEVKMNDESANIGDPVAAADAMTVESSETATTEGENAMEAAPIKADEEQMDVDESNSVDAMDL